MPTPDTVPPVTDALRAEARANPGAWIYAIDPGFDGQAEVPPEGVVGAWRATDRGELGDDFTANPRYLPTPQARGWDQPSTALERVLQLALSGYLPDARLAQEFGSAEIYIFSRQGGGIFVAPAQDGAELVYAYTDAGKASASGYGEHQVIRGADLVSALPDGVKIALNPGSRVSSIIDPSDVTMP